VPVRARLGGIAPRIGCCAGSAARSRGDRWIEAEYNRIGDACVACRNKLQDPSEIDNPDLNALEDCPFAALPACHRRRLIRMGQAVCPLGAWQCRVPPEATAASPQPGADSPVLLEI